MFSKAVGVMSGILSLLLLALTCQEYSRYQDYKQFVDKASEIEIERISPLVHRENYSDLLERKYQIISKARKIFAEGE